MRAVFHRIYRGFLVIFFRIRGKNCRKNCWVYFRRKYPKVYQRRPETHNYPAKLIRMYSIWKTCKSMWLMFRDPVKFMGILIFFRRFLNLIYIIGVFPEPDKDRVIQIANMVLRQGEKEPFIRNVLTLDTCAPIVGSQVVSCKTEEELLTVR